MRSRPTELLILCIALFFNGCGMYYRHGLEAERLHQAESVVVGNTSHLPPELEKAILALNPENVSGQEVREVLSHAPAPRIIKIHGGIARVIPRMVSFSEFLIGMGYPAISLTNESDGTYSFSCYERSEKIAGVIAWYYEQDGLRPIMVGHSQGGMQVVKVLYQFAESSKLHVWNPLTWNEEERWEIVDPLTGRKKPANKLKLPFATAVGAGGLTRALPNQWDMTLRLHSIPDSVEEFTGFCKELDPLGGDYLGYSSANHFKSAAKAQVRNVWLPREYVHGEIPDTKHLLKDPKMMDWINRYRPSNEPVSTPKLEVHFEGNSSNILWAAEVWYSIKKHWVLELQRRIQARNSRENAS